MSEKHPMKILLNLRKTVESIQNFIWLQIYLELRIKRVLIEGNYSVNNLLISNAGPFNITLTNVTATGIVDLEINKEGKLYADKSSIDMKYENIEVFELKRILVFHEDHYLKHSCVHNYVIIDYCRLCLWILAAFSSRS